MSYPSNYHCFKIYMMRNRIEKYILDTYKEVVKRPNFVEKSIKVLNNFEDIKTVMFNVFNKSVLLWSTIAQSKNLEFKYVQYLFEEILSTKHQGMELWTEIANYIQYSTTFILFYQWFSKDIWNMKVLLSEDEIDGMTQKIENYDFRVEELMQNHILDQLVFREDYVSVHINMELGHLGNIKGITKNCYKLFGWTKEELMGCNIKK
jgi:hypothetical protein